MFANCCCQETTPQASQLTYDPTTEEDSVRHPVEPCYEDDGGASAVDSADASYSPEEKAEEKARLQELVKSFAKRAVQGIRCTAVDVNTGECVAAKYSVDRKLQQLILSVIGQSDEVCYLAQIAEIYRIDDGDEFLPKPILSRLSQADQERMLYIVHGPQQEKQLCILENDIDDRERFVTCVKILRLYSQQNTPGSDQ